MPYFCYLRPASLSLFWLVFFSLFPLNLSAQNQPLQSKESLHQQVLEHLKQKVDQQIFDPEIKIRPISPRLRLPLCQTEVELEDKQPTKVTGRMSIKLSCPDPFWKLYVSVNIEGYLPVVKSARGILRQSEIKAEDVVQELLPYQRVRKGAFTEPKEVIGMRSKRAIGPNRVITVNMLEPPYIVFAKRRVNILTRIGHIRVESAGIALEDGTKGQQIKVQNVSSKRVIRAIVTGPNQVEVP